MEFGTRYNRHCRTLGRASTGFHLGSIPLSFQRHMHCWYSTNQATSRKLVFQLVQKMIIELELTYTWKSKRSGETSPISSVTSFLPLSSGLDTCSWVSPDRYCNRKREENENATWWCLFWTSLHSTTYHWSIYIHAVPTDRIGFSFVVELTTIGAVSSVVGTSTRPITLVVVVAMFLMEFGFGWRMRWLPCRWEKQNI